VIRQANRRHATHALQATNVFFEKMLFQAMFVVASAVTPSHEQNDCEDYGGQDEERADACDNDAQHRSCAVARVAQSIPASAGAAWLRAHI
jgi:hypothetical protein